jgi:hypothetical protein
VLTLASSISPMGLSDEERLVRQFPVYDALRIRASSAVTVPVSKALLLTSTTAFLRSLLPKKMATAVEQNA